jgi:hypothetical protein
MSTRSTIWVWYRGLGIHVYREMLNGRYCVAIGKPETSYPRLVVPLWRYR